MTDDDRRAAALASFHTVLNIGPRLIEALDVIEDHGGLRGLMASGVLQAKSAEKAKRVLAEVCREAKVQTSGLERPAPRPAVQGLVRRQANRLDHKWKPVV